VKRANFLVQYYTETTIERISAIVMQIHANNVLIIDSIKNQIFLMGGAGYAREMEFSEHIRRGLKTYRISTRHSTVNFNGKIIYHITALNRNVFGNTAPVPK
jgi:hypothetical protein